MPLDTISQLLLEDNITRASWASGLHSGGPLPHTLGSLSLTRCAEYGTQLWQLPRRSGWTRSSAMFFLEVPWLLLPSLVQLLGSGHLRSPLGISSCPIHPTREAVDMAGHSWSHGGGLRVPSTVWKRCCVAQCVGEGVAGKRWNHG